MGNQAADQIAEFYVEQNQLMTGDHLTGDQVKKFTEAFEYVDVVERASDFRSLAAIRDIPVGTVLGLFDGVFEAKNTRYNYTLDDNVFVMNCSRLVLINHSCVPNSNLKFPGPSAHASQFSSLAALAEAYPEEVFPVLVTIKPIAKGEDVTANYLTTEWELNFPFDCHCAGGPDLCVGRVRGAKYLTAAQVAQMSPLMTPRILKLYKAGESDTAVDHSKDVDNQSKE